jgi:hypothetical protein
MINLKLNIRNTVLTAIAISLTGSFHSCKQRDDWPEFDVSPKAPVEESVEQDNDKTWYVQTLEGKGNTMFKRFITDSIFNLNDGVTYAKIQFIDGLDQIQLMHIIEADLNNSKIGVVSMVPFGIFLPNLQTIPDMARDNDGLGGKIIAAINGDNWAASTTNAYGNPANGFVSYGKNMKSWVNNATNITRPYLGVKKNGEVMIGNTQNNVTYPFTWIEQTEFEHLVAGPSTWVTYNQYNNTANTDLILRSVVGLNEVEKKLYFITFDGRTPGVATGMGAPSIARIIRDLGVTKSFMPNLHANVQLVVRKEEKFNNKDKVSFPLVNTPMTSAGVRSVGTLANGIALVVKD